jgi:hypothetical protein
MDAVFAKSQDALRGKRQPMLKRKPGVAIMIAVGKPPMGKMGKGMEAPTRTPVMGKRDDEEMEREDERPGKGMSKAEKIAALEEQIGALKAELALLEDEDEAEDEDAMDEDEDEDDEY